MGSLLGMDELHISLAAETLWHFGALNITNSMVMMFIAMIAVGLLLRAGASRAGLMPGGRLQTMVEGIVEALVGLVDSVAGGSLGRRIFPLIATFFLFILVANWMALLPGVGTIGLCESDKYVSTPAPAPGSAASVPGAAASPGAATTETKAKAETKEGAAKETHNNTCASGTHFVPLLRAANADLNMTLAMALIAVGFVQFIGVRFHGVGGYLKELATPPFLFPVHVISELSRVLSLAARLFGNIFGGEVFLLVIFFLMPLFAPLLPLGLETFFGFIQAVLFSVLTLVYVSMAAAGHGSGHGDEHEAEHGHGEAAHPAPAIGD